MLRGDSFDGVRLVVSVFEDGDAKADGSFLQNETGGLLNGVGKDLGGFLVHGRAALVVAKADDQHLAETALDWADEVGVQLYAVDRDDEVGFIGCAVEPDGAAVGAVAKINGVHRCHNGNAETLLRDPVAREDLALALLRAAAVAAHGGDDKGLRTQFFERVYRRFDDGIEILDAAAADADGDTHAGLDERADLRLCELCAHRAGHILQTGLVKLLPHTIHPRQRTLQVFFQKDRHENTSFRM